jgi:hypothetical protein
MFDPLYRPNVRLKAMSHGPLRSNNDYQFGFYDIGVLRHALDFSDAPSYRVAALPIPKDPFQKAQLEKIISHPSVQYALVDKNKVVACIIDAEEGWMSVLNKMGFELKGGSKTAKRMKSFHRATLINAHFDTLNIKWVDSLDYSNYNFNNPDGWSSWVVDAIPRLLDGCFVVSSRLIQEGIANLPVYEPHNTLDTSDYYYDPAVKAQLVHFLANSKVFNGRIICPEGIIKGNIIVSDNLPLDIDVISSRENLKSEVIYNNGYRLLAEPQGPKSRVITDDQTVVNVPKLFRKSDMEMWLKEEYEKMFQQSIDGNLLTNWKSVFLRNFSRENQDIEDAEVHSRISYVGYRWVSMGLSITGSPWLFETLAVSHAKPLQKRIPIPCAVYEQIIPESLARMAGYDIQVEEGTIRRLNDIGVHVVNDFDWLEIYESHGGHDADDFFKLFYRTMESGPHDGHKVVIAVRSPNGYGEYSIFRYVEDEWYPTWEKSNGEIVSFPSVNGRNWPKRLSQSIRNNEVVYRGLPSASSSSASTRTATDSYSIADVMADVETAMKGGNVGRYVNSCMLHSMTLARHRPQQLCSMEAAIDGCTQTSDPHDRDAIDKESELIIKEIIDSKKPLDHDLWFGRFRSLIEKYPDVQTYEGKITQLNSLCSEYYQRYVNRVRNHAQSNVRPSEFIHKLGQRLYYHALPVVRKFRMNIYNTNYSEAISTSDGIKRSDWENLYTDIKNRIESYERIQDRYDFVLSLYSVSINVPTSSGKISDQIVMNKVIYPYLEKALQHYGLANRIVMNYTDGKIKMNEHTVSSWSYPDDDGQIHHFTDALAYQEFHGQFSPIVFSYTKTFDTSN